MLPVARRYAALEISGLSNLSAVRDISSRVRPAKGPPDLSLSVSLRAATIR